MLRAHCTHSREMLFLLVLKPPPLAAGNLQQPRGRMGIILPKEEVDWRSSVCASQKSTGPTSKPAARVAYSFWMRDGSCGLYKELRSLSPVIRNQLKIGDKALQPLKSLWLHQTKEKALGLPPVAHSKQVVYHRLESDFFL